MEGKEKVAILTPNIKITNTSTANNICTQGNDTSVSLSQQFLSLLLKDEEKVPILTPKPKLLILALLTTFVYTVKGENCVLFSSVQEMAGWLLLTFLICLHSKLSSIIHCIIAY